MSDIKQKPERKEEEDALRERERHLHTIVDLLPALIAYVGPDERYRFINKAYKTWFGQSRMGLFGKLVREVVGDAKYSEIRPNIEAALSGRAVQFETSLPPNKDGDTHYGRINYVPDIAHDGSVKGFFSLISDVTERKRAEQALRASHEQLEALSSRLIEIQEMLQGAGVVERGLGIHAVALGESYLSPRIANHVVSGQVLAKADVTTDLRRLTSRQRQILQLIAEGHSTKEIARKLGLSVKTIETHRANLMKRLGIHDVAGLVRFAIRTGLVTP